MRVGSRDENVVIRPCQQGATWKPVQTFVCIATAPTVHGRVLPHALMLVALIHSHSGLLWEIHMHETPELSCSMNGALHVRQLSP